MATLSELQQEVYDEIGLNATSDATKVTRELNRGVRDFLRKTRCYQDQITATPGAVSEYTLASTVLDVVDLSVSGQWNSPERVSARDVRRYARAAASTNTGVVQYYALAGNNLLIFYPTLSAATVLDLLVVPAPTALSGASDDPSSASLGGIPVDYHEAIARYAMWKMGSYDDDQSSAQGSRYKDEYDQLVRAARRELLRKGGSRLSRARVGRRVARPHDPSQDV